MARQPDSPSDPPPNDRDSLERAKDFQRQGDALIERARRLGRVIQDRVRQLMKPSDAGNRQA